MCITKAVALLSCLCQTLLIDLSITEKRGSPMAQMVKCLPAMWETQVWSLGWEDPLEKEMAAHSGILAWKIPWTEEPGRLQSMGWQRVGHNWATSLSLIEKTKTKNNTLLEFSLMIKLYSIWELSTYALLKEFRTGTSKYAALVYWLFWAEDIWNSLYRERNSLNSPICLKTESPKGTQLP